MQHPPPHPPPPHPLSPSQDTKWGYVDTHPYVHPFFLSIAVILLVYVFVKFRLLTVYTMYMHRKWKLLWLGAGCFPIYTSFLNCDNNLILEHIFFSLLYLLAKIKVYIFFYLLYIGLYGSGEISVVINVLATISVYSLYTVESLYLLNLFVHLTDEF